MARLFMRLNFLLSIPVSILFILHSRRMHPAYRMTWWRKIGLGLRMVLNKLRIPTGTSYRAHLAMALKLLEIPPGVRGDVVECGAWKGGSAANLSLVCRIVGRRLKIFDSFEGLPEPELSDREGEKYKKGDYRGSQQEVQENIRRYGAIECCDFIKGWFHETLPELRSPVVLALIDVDLEASLDTCVRYLWPNLVDDGYLFTDECASLGYISLFFSERWWSEHFNRTPPGLIGAGTGLPLGEYFIGPWSQHDAYPLQHASTGAYTQKSMSSFWTYYPEEKNRTPKTAL